jgi:hypothetical protein
MAGRGTHVDSELSPNVPAPSLAKQGEFGSGGGRGTHDDGSINVPSMKPSELKPGIDNGGDTDSKISPPYTKGQPE